MRFNAFLEVQQACLVLLLMVSIATFVSSRVIPLTAELDVFSNDTSLDTLTSTLRPFNFTNIASNFSMKEDAPDGPGNTPQIQSMLFGPGHEAVLNQIIHAYADAYYLAGSMAYLDLTHDPDAYWVAAKYFQFKDILAVTTVFRIINGKNANILDLRAWDGDLPSVGECKKEALTLAYTLGGTGPRPYQALCPIWHYLPVLIDRADTKQYVFQARTCDQLDPFVSWKMGTQGSTVLHELLHFTKMYADVIILPPILDNELPSKGYAAYGAWAAQQLVFENPDATLTNADNWTWFALELWWTRKCGHRFDRPPTELDGSNSDPTKWNPGAPAPF